MAIVACSLPRRLAAILIAASALPVLADEALVVRKQTRAGEDVVVRGFAEFDAQCRLKGVQQIAVASAPRGGSVEMRPGDVVIGPNWVGRGQCAGTTLRGVQVVYVPAPGFTGTDRFSLDVRYSMGRTVRADVEIKVR